RMRIAILLRFKQIREQSIMDKPISIPSPQLLASNSIRHSKLCGSALKQVRYNDLDFSTSTVPVNGCVNTMGLPACVSFHASPFVFGCRLRAGSTTGGQCARARHHGNPNLNQSGKSTGGERTAKSVGKAIR